MSIYEKQEAARGSKDMDAYAATLHDEFEFVMHLDNSRKNKDEAMEMFTFLINNDDFVIHESRCLYENDDAMVTHAIMSFPDGTREAVLAYNQIKDGKIIRLETGATLLP